jgi:hypothetical protein
MRHLYKKGDSQVIDFFFFGWGGGCRRNNGKDLLFPSGPSYIYIGVDI